MFKEDEAVANDIGFIEEDQSDMAKNVVGNLRRNIEY